MNGAILNFIIVYIVMSLFTVSVTISVLVEGTDVPTIIIVNNYKLRLYNFVNGNKPLYYLLITLICLLYFAVGGLLFMWTAICVFAALISNIFMVYCSTMEQTHYPTPPTTPEPSTHAVPTAEP